MFGGHASERECEPERKGEAYAVDGMARGEGFVRLKSECCPKTMDTHHVLWEAGFVGAYCLGCDLFFITHSGQFSLFGVPILY